MTSQPTPTTRILNPSVLRIALLTVLIASAAPALAQNPVPFVDQPLVPDATAPGGAGFTLTVNGAGFVAASTVNWNGSPLATTFVSSAQLTATVPASDVATPSTANVTVVNPSPGGGVSNTQFFSIVVPGASISFLPAVTYGSGESVPASVAVADLNGDGDLDVVVANTSTVGMLLGNGDGTLQSAITYPAGSIQSSIAVADFRGDGRLDVVTSGESSTVPFAASVLLGNGAGGFQPPAEYGSGGVDDNSVAVADVNGDGNPDIVVANWGGGTGGGAIGVLLGNGDGTFKPAVTYNSAGGTANAVVIADLRNDGKLDLLVADTNCNSCSTSVIAVLLGNGDGTFQPATTYGTGGTGGGEGLFGGESLAVADVNGDGKPDVAVVNSQSNTVAVLLGNGDGTFQPAVTYSTGGSYPDAVAIADLNGDGKLDLVVVNQSEGTAAVLLGNGDGTFQAAVTFSTGGTEPNSVVAADLNGDGRPDLIVANEGSAAVGVLVNSTASGSPTTTTLVSSSNPSSYGQTVAFTASVTSTAGTPTGTVVFYDGLTSIGSATLSSGKAAISVSSLAAGSHSITAAYQGSSTFASSTSAVLTQVVNGVTTATTLASSLNPSTFGQSVTFTAAVTSSSGTPTGTVVFTDASTSTTLGSATLVSGTASISVSSLAAGSHSITAAYQGSAGFNPSTSAPLSQIINLATTTTSLTSSLDPASTNQTITFTATVTSQYSGAATGSVTFYSGSQTLGTATLSSNRATLSTSFTTAGTYSISAKYNGDASNLGSTSSALSQVINATITSTTTTLTSSPNPSSVGQAVTFTATVSSSAGSPPNGEVVTFYNGAAVLGTAPLSAGIASLTTSSLQAGTFTITASYSGDANFAASTSPALRQVVNVTSKSATSTTISSSLNPSAHGQAITFTATVTSTGGTPPIGETVTFYNGLNVLGTAPLRGGIASLTTSSLQSGIHTISAAYLGDANFTGSTSPVLQQAVDTTSQSATTTALTSSLNPSIYGQRVTWTAIVTTSGSSTPTGRVHFKWGSYSIGTATLNPSGVATLSLSNLNADHYPLFAVYNGDANNGASASPILNQVITQATSSATLTSSPNPSTQGQSVTFTAEITSPTTTPTGPVTFTAGKATLGTVELTKGKATLTTSTLAVGSTTVTVTYPWKSNISESSASVTQVVQQSGGGGSQQ
jgi:hypothetical protein